MAAGQFFAQSGNLFGRHRACIVPPLTPFVGKDVSNSLVGQRFPPWLHDGAPKFLTLDSDWTLQAVEDDHRRPTRSARCKLRTSERRILTGNAETVGLMTGLAVCREDLFATIVRRKFRLLFTRARANDAFLCRRRTTHRIETVSGKVSGITSEVGATEENRKSVNGDQPYRERFQSNARLAFLALDRSVHFLNIRNFAVIGPLSGKGRAIGSWLVHFAPLAAAGEAVGGDDDGAADFTSFSGCDWSRDIK